MTDFQCSSAGHTQGNCLFSRRGFMRASGASVAAMVASPQWGAAQLVSSAFASDYRALVCVFLYGGNDSFNMVVPRSSLEYSAYAASRQNLAMRQSDLLPITTPGIEANYGIHPAMPELVRLFELGQAAFVVNVGPLIEPANRESVADRAVNLPPQLFSHSDQQDQWHGLGDRSNGWGGRIADILQGLVIQPLPTNASLYSNNLFQVGRNTVPYTMGMAGPAAFQGFDDTEYWQAHRNVFERILAAPRSSVYARAFAEVQRRAIVAADQLNAALATGRPIVTSFPRTPLGQQLGTVARLIAVRGSLGMRRQVFFVGMGGFDTHDQQLERHPPLLADLSASLAAFHEATVELGLAESVTTFTQSEFGRTLTSNGDGSDHGWGGIQIVVGGSVRGGRFYGAYPLLELEGLDDSGGGRIIPSTSTDQFAATLARWFGVPEERLDTVAPNLKNFLLHDLGFMV